MSKKTLTKIPVVLLLVVMLVSCLVITPTLAATEYVTYRKGANSVSDAYKGSKYYTQLTNVALTGDDPTNVIAVALSQVGYLEGNSTKGFDGVTGGGNSNYTEMCWNIGWYGGSSGYNFEWCAAFVSFCLLQGRATDHSSTEDLCRKHYDDPTYIWREVSCSAWERNLTAAGIFKGRTYTPSTGDLIFFVRSGSNGHVGLVLYTDAKYVYTIEGNTNPNFNGQVEGDGNGVYVKRYQLGQSDIYGYGALASGGKYNKTDSASKIDFTGKNPTPGLYVSAHKDGKGLFADPEFTTRLLKVPTFAQVEVLEVVKTHTLQDNQSDNDEVISTLKVKYNGQIGYMKDTEAARLIQITAAEHEHSYSMETVDAKYLVSDATCTAPATYRKSCFCGVAGTETFTSGDVNPDNHTNVEFKYTSNGDNTHTVKYACCDALVDEGVACSGGSATCTALASCKLCDAPYGEALTHFFTEIKYNTTQHWNKCESCTEITEKLAHTFDDSDKCLCGYVKSSDAPVQDGTQGGTDATPSVPNTPGFDFAIGDTLPDDAEVLAKPIDAKSDEGKAILEKVEGYGFNKDKGVVIYDIHALSQGAKVQPDGQIAVTLEKPIDNVDSYVIYHIKDNGSIQIINADVQDGKLSFNISSFSNFVFAEKTDKIPGSGLADNVVACLVLTVAIVAQLAIFAFVWFVIKKKSFADLFKKQDNN